MDFLFIPSELHESSWLSLLPDRLSIIIYFKRSRKAFSFLLLWTRQKSLQRSMMVRKMNNFSRTSMIDEFECYDSIFLMEMQIKFVMSWVSLQI